MKTSEKVNAIRQELDDAPPSTEGERGAYLGARRRLVEAHALLSAMESGERYALELDMVGVDVLRAAQDQHEGERVAWREKLEEVRGELDVQRARADGAESYARGLEDGNAVTLGRVAELEARLGSAEAECIALRDSHRAVKSELEERRLEVSLLEEEVARLKKLEAAAAEVGPADAEPTP